MQRIFHMNKKKKTIIICSIVLTVLAGIFIYNYNQFDLKKINKVTLLKADQQIGLSKQDENRLIEIFSGGIILRDSGLACGTHEYLKLKLTNDKGSIVIRFPFDGCDSFFIEGTHSKYVFFGEKEIELRSEVDRIVEKYGVKVHV